MKIVNVSTYIGCYKQTWLKGLKKLSLTRWITCVLSICVQEGLLRQSDYHESVCKPFATAVLCSVGAGTTTSVSANSTTFCCGMIRSTMSVQVMIWVYKHAAWTDMPLETWKLWTLHYVDWKASLDRWAKSLSHWGDAIQVIRSVLDCKMIAFLPCYQAMKDPAPMSLSGLSGKSKRFPPAFTAHTACKALRIWNDVLITSWKSSSSIPLPEQFPTRTPFDVSFPERWDGVSPAEDSVLAEGLPEIPLSWVHIPFAERMRFAEGGIARMVQPKNLPFNLAATPVLEIQDAIIWHLTYHDNFGHLMGEHGPTLHNVLCTFMGK